MTRGRRVATPKAEELIAAVDGSVNSGLEFEESDDELEAIELTPEDLYEDNAPLAEEEEVVIGPVEVIEKPKKVEKVAEKAIAKPGTVYVTYKGLKTPGRPPVAITLIVPEDGTDPEDPRASISKGETFVLRPGVPARATEEEANWMVRHPVYLIEKS
jgi:hypothetical protein